MARCACGRGTATGAVKALLAAGANIHARDDAPLRGAEGNHHAETARVLKDWMARRDHSPAACSRSGVVTF